MLGKGLESLIPRKGDQQNISSDGLTRAADNDARPQPPSDETSSGFAGHGVPPVFLPVGDDPIDDPARELPPASETPELPAASEEEKLMPLPEETALPSAPAFSAMPAASAIAAASAPAPSGAILKKIDDPAPAVPAAPRVPPAPIFPASADSPLKRKTDQPQESIFHIEVDRIAPNPGQPRRYFDETALRELANSIREFGFIQPLVVTKKETETPAGIDVSYELIAGERRLNAAKLLGLTLVPAIVRKVNLEREKIELAIIENIQRENLNPIETARAFQRLQEEFRMTQREIAAKLGKSRETVANSVRLLDLPAYLQEALQEKKISESHGRLLLSIGDPAAQKRLFDDIVTRGLTTRDVKERVNAITRRPPRADGHAGELTPELKAMQDHLSAALGAPVEIHHGGANGKIMITFYSEEELDNILRRLGTE